MTIKWDVRLFCGAQRWNLPSLVSLVWCWPWFSCVKPYKCLKSLKWNGLCQSMVVHSLVIDNTNPQIHLLMIYRQWWMFHAYSMWLVVLTTQVLLILLVMSHVIVTCAGTSWKNPHLTKENNLALVSGLLGWKVDQLRFFGVSYLLSVLLGPKLHFSNLGASYALGVVYILG